MYLNFAIKYNNKWWLFNKWGGVTYSKSFKGDVQTPTLPQEILNPFKVHRRLEKTEQIRMSYYIRFYVNVLMFASQKFYPLIYLLSFLRLGIYKNAQQASWVFQQVTKGQQQKLLCLPRSVFIATTSKRFKEHGTMYIGIFLPSRNMHAWVIEDGLQTDEWDNYWILYQPLIMMRG